MVVNGIVASDVVGIVDDVVDADVEDGIAADEVVSEEVSTKALRFSVSNIVNISSRSVSCSNSLTLNDFMLKSSSDDSFDDSSEA